ncbi:MULTISPECIES: non-ribosomal peptide synthetase [Nostoc]|uniref:Amino acid adenylation domain-containing protein n=2 Tax=Nostoc TaxID=1177 RepID=A0ABR8I202_9NOSO|nr:MULTISPECIES: non-ribosomal peptide synthetase [Nostoc]MBD2559797.1 amino acid adenylation domain-containing protein [Nostoc linckia FACHB-391]MBD2645239.1 amino acid adenylation domain-containing protein [Nostoc foliaceum FACHB-393]
MENKKNIENIYPLSPTQQGILFHSLYSPNSGVYVAQISCTLSGSLNISALKKASQLVMEQHSVLRTSFHWERRDQPFQVVYRHINLPWEQHDWRGISPDEQQQLLENFLQADREQDFDLDKPPLMRLTLIQLADDKHQFIWSKHHLILDGWSTAIVFKEVFDAYEALHQGNNLPTIRSRPYGDYVAWLQQQDLLQAETFWRLMLKGFTSPTALKVDRNFRDSNSKLDQSEQQIQLSEATTSALKSLAQQHQLTLNTLVQGAFALLLSRYSGEADILFGVTSSGRPPTLAGVESMVGVFINTLPLRVNANPEDFLIPWLKQLQTQQIEAREYDYSPLVEVQAWSEVPRGTPLFESILVFENYPIDSSLPKQSENLGIREVRFVESINYPLTMLVNGGTELSINIWYDCQRFDADTITRMLGHFGTLLEEMVANPEKRLKDLQLLTQGERHQLLVECNDTQVNYPQDKCIHQLFEDQVERSPDAIALVFEDQQLTYQELNQRANQLAHHLQKLGVRPEVLVGICIERSLEMIIGLLGILKAGGAYVPIDPDYPQQRLAFFLEDCQTKILLTQDKFKQTLPRHEIQLIRLDSEWATIAQEPSDNPVTGIAAHNLAYVIYTSGSTGVPKGAMNTHVGVCNRLLWMQDTYQLTQADRILQKTPFSFDVSVWEFFWPLFTGACLVVAQPGVHRDSAYLVKLIAEQKITTIHFVPSMLAIFLEEQGLEACNCLKRVICSGEALSFNLQQRFFAHLGAELHNLYGPTEAAIDVTAWTCDRTSTRQEVPIGSPIANMQMYILDNQQRLVSVGIPGELYIGGVGLARGYYNRPELTAEKFIPHPFSQEPGKRLYKTGDIGRYQPDGTIEYLGRIDNQVKVRGFRIELGEIEAILLQYSGVREAAVLVREEQPGDKHLVAYIVPMSEQVLTSSELRNYLKGRMPNYMVPTAFVMLEALPLTPNGKVDRRSLPAPDTVRPELNEGFVAPRTPVEDLLAGIWSQVLSLERVGIHDNFFDLGGHSLLATQVMSRLYKAFQIELPLRYLFESPTIARLAEHIETAIRTGSGLTVVPLESVSRDKDLPLSFSQQRLWLLNQLEPNSSLYNIPAAVRLTGLLNIAALEHSFNELIRRHEVLRTRFVTVDGQPFQIVEPTLSLTLPLVDLRSRSVSFRESLSQTEREAEVEKLAQQEANRPFELAKSPLLRCVLLQLDDTEHVLLVTMHHIISDAWSVAILIRELGELYKAFSANQPSPLTELPIQYADFAIWQRQYLQGETLKTQLNYWKQQLNGAPPLLQLPTDRPRPAVRTFRGATQSFTLPKSLTEEIKNLSNREGVTLFMTLLAAFKTLLYCWTGQEDIIVGSPIANRTRAELEELIGFFVNTLVLRTDLSDNPSFRELLSRVRERTLKAYTHQDLPFEKLIEELQPERNPSYNPLFQVWFVLQNIAMPSLELSNLHITSLNIDSDRAKHDLRLELAESEEGLIGSIGYRVDLFEKATIARMAKDFESLLIQITMQPNIKLNNLVEILTETDRQQQMIREKELENATRQKLKMTKRKSISGI